MIRFLLLAFLICSSQQRSIELDHGLPHPVKVHNWAPKLEVGQISSVAVNHNEQPVIFQRGPVVWDQSSFNNDWTLAKKDIISEDTILVLDPETGSILSSKGKDLFYMPHGLTLDKNGNAYVTDTGLHQVMRIPANDSTPDLILGEAFVQGSDEKHFCAPTSVAVAEKSDFFFVADGYCNSRILKFHKDGSLVSIIKGNWIVAHSLALFEDSDVLCVANREGQEVDCLRAGLYPAEDIDDVTGTMVTSYPNLGRVFAIAATGNALLAMSGEPQVLGLTIDTVAAEPKVADIWANGSTDDIVSPHDMAVSNKGDALYVAEIGDKSKHFKLHKFEIVKKSDNISN